MEAPGGVPPVAVTVVGPESTGKTTLAAALAARLGTVWSVEGARAYLDARLAAAAPGAHPPAPLGPADVDPIAHLQVALEDDAAHRAATTGTALVVRDTDLVSTVVYARHYYGRVSPWIEAAALARRAALYLLCAPDLPWRHDPQRDPALADAAARDAMTTRFAAVLAEFGCAVVEVRGAGARRLDAALAAIEERGLGSRPPDPAA